MNFLYKNQGYEKLIVYQKSLELVIQIYKLTKYFPKDEQYILIPQIRRAAISIVANIVEGYSKNSTKEFVRFLEISKGSINELEVHIRISYELKYFDRMEFDKVCSLILEVKKLLYGYQKSLRK